MFVSFFKMPLNHESKSGATPRYLLRLVLLAVTPQAERNRRAGHASHPEGSGHLLWDARRRLAGGAGSQQQASVANYRVQNPPLQVTLVSGSQDAASWLDLWSHLIGFVCFFISNGGDEVALQGLNVIDRNRDHSLVRNGERCGSKLWFSDFPAKHKRVSFGFICAFHYIGS